MATLQSKLFLFFLLILAPLLATKTATSQQVRILYYSSMPEIVRDEGRPGLAQVAAVVKYEREVADNVLFIHGGASLGPSILGALDRGAHMIDVLNTLEPDLMAVGKREFSYKEDQFTLHALSAGFPFVASNILEKSTQQPLEGVEPNFLLEINGINIGFIALTSGNAVTQYAANSITVLPVEEVIRSTATQLRAEGADVVVILADTDFSDLSEYTKDKTADVILYAHNFDNPFSADAGGTTIREGALDGRLVALTLEKKMVGSETVIDSALETIDLRPIEKDPETLSLVQSYANRLEVLLKKEIGVTSRGFNTIRDNVRTKESAFGNLVADAVRSAMKADVAFLNSGGIRGNRYYQAGHTLTREDIQMELPFNNTVELFEVTGAQLLQALEWGVGCIERVDGCFLQVSNIEMTYDPSLPIGARVKKVTIDGKPLVASHKYRLGTLNFLAQGGDGFDMLVDSPRLTQTGSGKLLWEVVASYLSALPEITPNIEGRVIRNNSDK